MLDPGAAMRLGGDPSGLQPAELAQLRAAKPDAADIFLPGGKGINFIKQYNAAGLAGAVPLFGPGFSAGQILCRQ